MNYTWFKIKRKDKDRVLLRCFKRRITVYDTKQTDTAFYFLILSSDIKTLKKGSLLRIETVREQGFQELKHFFKTYWIFLLTGLIVALFFFLLTHVMVQVEVIHSKKEIRDLLTNALYERGVKKNSFRKSFQELEQIKQEILDQYPDQLEWIEIEVHGMNYVVRVEQRLLKEETVKKEKCNIVAKKGGLIKELEYQEGEAVVQTNDYVKEGDLLIRGTIQKEEETKKEVCATGNVYAEVWYKGSISIPKSEEVTNETGKVRWNFKIKNNTIDTYIFRSRVEPYVEEEKALFTIFGTTFYFVRQKEVQKEVVTYDLEHLEQKAMALLDEKISSPFQDGERIIDKRILKQDEEEGNYYLEVFYIVLEQIGLQQEF